MGNLNDVHQGTLLTFAGLINKYKNYALIVVLFLLTSCSLVKPVEFQNVNSLSIEEDGGKIKFTANLTLYNPNGFEFTVDKADIDVYAENINLGKLKIPEMVVIQKRNSFTGDFIVEISLVKMLLAGKNIMPKLNSGKINMEMKGFVEADVLWMHKKFEVEHKELIDIRK